MFYVRPSIYIDKNFEGKKSNQHKHKLITDNASLFLAIVNILADVAHIFKQTVLPCTSMASAPACVVADTGADQYRADVVTVSRAIPHTRTAHYGCSSNRPISHLILFSPEFTLLSFGD